MLPWPWWMTWGKLSSQRPKVLLELPPWFLWPPLGVGCLKSCGGLHGFAMPHAATLFFALLFPLKSGHMNNPHWEYSVNQSILTISHGCVHNLHHFHLFGLFFFGPLPVPQVLRRWRVVSKTPLLVLCRDRPAADACDSSADLTGGPLRCLKAPRRLGVEAIVAKYLVPGPYWPQKPIQKCEKKGTVTVITVLQLV